MPVAPMWTTRNAADNGAFAPKLPKNGEDSGFRTTLLPPKSKGITFDLNTGQSHTAEIMSETS